MEVRVCGIDIGAWQRFPRNKLTLSLLWVVGLRSRGRALVSFKQVVCDR